MLMPSALSCDSSHPPPVTRLQASLFTSPPSSPPANAQSTIGNIVSSCRALQSMLTAPASNDNNNNNRLSSLPTPPLSHATLPPAPPMKLRLRSSKSHPTANGELLPRKKVVKRSAPRAPPRGVNKRRRATDDDMGRDDNSSDEEYDEEMLPSTPKRARIAPEVLPMGLERSDFHTLQDGSNPSEEIKTDGTEVEVEADGEEWSKEDDQVLVELVLEKLNLSKSDWEEIGKSFSNLGGRRDRASCGRRWKTLMANSDVGLKSTRSRRAKLHGTWR